MHRFRKIDRSLKHEKEKNIYFTYVSASDWLWLLRKIEKEACRFFSDLCVHYAAATDILPKHIVYNPQIIYATLSTYV